MPEDPVKRAEVRFFIEYYSSKVLPNMYALLTNPTDEGAQKFKENVSTAYKRVSRHWRRQFVMD